MPESLTRKKTPLVPLGMAGFKSEWWPASNRKPGRLHVVHAARLNRYPHTTTSTSRTAALASIGVAPVSTATAVSVAGAHEWASNTTQDALKQTQPDIQFEEAAILSAFDSNRALIYAIAAKVYSRGAKASTMSSPLT
jgi:hypothetical protein